MILVSVVLVLSFGQTDTHKITDAAKRFTPATVVGVSNYPVLLLTISPPLVTTKYKRVHDFMHFIDF